MTSLTEKALILQREITHGSLLEHGEKVIVNLMKQVLLQLEISV